MAFSLTCPECRAVLRSANAIPAGRKVKCPKCNKIFQSPDPPQKDPAPSPPAVVAKPQPAPPAKPVVEIIPFADETKKAKAASSVRIPAIDSIQLKGEDSLEQGWEIVDDEPPAAPTKKEKPPPPRKQALQAAEIVEDEEDEEENEEAASRNVRTSRQAARGRRRDADEEDLESRRRPRGRRPEYDDDEDEDEEEDDFEDAPRRRTRRRKSGGGVVKVLIIAGLASVVVLGGSVLGGVAWYLNRDRNRGTGDENGAAYALADSVVVVRIDFTKLAGEPSMASRFETLVQRVLSSEFLTAIKRETGLEFADICERCYMVAGDPGAPGASSGPGTAVLQSRIPFTQRHIRNAAGKDVKTHSHKGKTYFSVTLGNKPRTLFMPSDRVIIISDLPEQQIKTMVESDGKTLALSNETQAMMQAVENYPLWYVVPFQDNVRTNLQTAASEPTLPGEFKPILRDLAKARVLGGGLNFSGDKARIELELNCGDEKAAKQIAKAAQDLWDRHLKGFVVQGAISQLRKEVADPVRDVIKSMKFRSDGLTARAQTQMNKLHLDALLADAGRQVRGLPGPGGGMVVTPFFNMRPKR